MKKSLSITIAGLIFNIEDDAYEKLDAYIESIKVHFSETEESSEIVEDIEGRIAERFSEMISKSSEIAGKVGVLLEVCYRLQS